MTDDEIAAELKALLPRAHAPYSGVHVACAVEGEDGRLSFGVNVENAAYPQGWCAETSAISAAVTGGAAGLKRVWVTSTLPGLIWPCGGCRQKIFEFACEGLEVVSLAADGASEAAAIEDLLPRGFRLAASEVKPG